VSCVAGSLLSLVVLLHYLIQLQLLDYDTWFELGECWIFHMIGASAHLWLVPFSGFSQFWLLELKIIRC
jgi:hypothetical protein